MEQKEKQLMIFLAGELRSRDHLAHLMKCNDFDFYAADAGYIKAFDFNIIPKHILGDFDSAEKPDTSNVVVFPKEKDQTDSEIALDLGILEGYRSIWMIAPFGGRFDHTMANLNLLLYAQSRNVSLKLYDGENLVFLMEKGVHVMTNDYQYYSFFSVGKSAVISLNGFKYPLAHHMIEKESSLCVSNEAEIAQPVVEVHQGLVLCVCIEKEIK